MSADELELRQRWRFEIIIPVIGFDAVLKQLATQAANAQVSGMESSAHQIIKDVNTVKINLWHQTQDSRITKDISDDHVRVDQHDGLRVIATPGGEVCRARVPIVG